MNLTDRYSRRNFIGRVVAGTATLSALTSTTYGLIPDVPDNDKHLGTNRPYSSGGDKKFVPVMITPFHSNLKIDFDGLSKLIDFYLHSGVKGFFANCLSSEMYALDDEERLALARHVVKRVNGEVPVVATGSFGETIEAQAEFAKKMYSTGVDAVILITSHFGGKDENDTVLIQRLEKFLRLTDTIPMGTYECPSPYKRILTPEILRFLLSTHRLIYHKDTSLDLEKIKVKLELAENSKLEIYDAHTPNAMFSLKMGAKGISSIAGNFYPEVFSWLCKNVNNPENQEDVKWLQSELTQADSIISQGYPTSAKYFLQKRGVLIEPISRSSKGALTIVQKETLDKMYTTLQGWHSRLGIQSNH